MACVELKNVSYRYPVSCAKNLRGINLSIEKGEFVAIIGKNGAGKTTLCNVIRGFIPHFYHGTITGSVTVNGKNVLEAGIGILSQDVGYVFQNPFNQNSGIKVTVYEEIAYGLENLGIARDEIFARVDAVIRLLNIEHLADKHPMKLSGGQCQRVALASVIVMEPEVLIIDEPTSQLDPKGTEDVFKIIDTMKKKGKTTILVEHKIDRIAEYADRVILMDAGTIVMDAPVDEALSDKRLMDYGVMLPQCAMLGLALREQGFELDRIPITIAQAKETIGKLMELGGAAHANS
ncbi:MAG TPA: ABC transporter ATP-binding protein [Feifaniaceae bacterium]|nr:ABC transporter ATP-binding protein [Feifaniaceae bacterium]